MNRRSNLIFRLPELLLLVVLGGCAALFLLLSENYNSTAALFPRWVAIASLIFLALSGFQLARSFKAASENSNEQLAEPITGGVSHLRVFLFLSQGIYIFLIYFFGFFPATLLFLLIAPLQMGYKRRGVVVVHAVLLSLLVTGSFVWLLNIQLPSGFVWSMW